MEKRIVGKIIFLNKGKKISLPLKYKNLQKVIGKKSVLTNAEAVFLGKEEGDEFSERLYEKVSKQGLSFIRIMPYVQNDNINQNEFLLTISLSDSLSKEDADNIKEEVNKIHKSKSGKKVIEQIYVHDKVEENKETYYYSQSVNDETSGIINTNRTLDSFINYKLKKLTKEEQEMFRKYFEFDLKRMIMEESDEYPITNRGEGVVIITKDGKKYVATKKKEEHRNEAIEMLSNITGETIDTSLTIEELVQKYNVTISRIYKTDRAAIFSYLPDNLTSMQIKKFTSFLRQAEDIEQELEKEGKPKILALVLGNENIKVDNLECANISEVTKRISEYENAYLRKNPGNILEIISSDISNFIKYFGNLMKSKDTDRERM